MPSVAPGPGSGLERLSGDMSWRGETGGFGGGTDGTTMALFRHHIEAEATALAWTRTVDTEQRQWVARRSEWKPAGEARDVQRHEESHWETVTNWQPGLPNAGGTPGLQQPGLQQPVTRQELRTRTYYTYEALEWREGRTLTASGAGQDDVRWPEYTLAPDERLRDESQAYSATFTAPDKQYEATLDEPQWRALTLGATYRLGLGLLGHVHEVTPV